MSKSIVAVSELSTDRFRWKTSDGKILRLAEMETSHVFNSMKMVFNHLAAHHGGDPVWFQQQYSDYHRRASEETAYMGALVVFLAGEIVRRGNLPQRYQCPFSMILDQVLPSGQSRELHRATALLEA